MVLTCRRCLWAASAARALALGALRGPLGALLRRQQRPRPLPASRRASCHAVTSPATLACSAPALAWLLVRGSSPACGRCTNLARRTQCGALSGMGTACKTSSGITFPYLSPHQVSKPAAGRSRPPRARGGRREPDQADLAASDAALGSGGSASTDAEEDGMLGDMGAEDCDAGAQSAPL